MQREIGLVLIEDGCAVRHPNYAAGKVLGYRQGKSDGLIVGGCGMDMGFHVVYQLGAALWPDGFGCIGERCRSCDHSNGDRNYRPNVALTTAAKGGPPAYEHWHRDSGYALRQEWL